MGWVYFDNFILENIDRIVFPVDSKVSVFIPSTGNICEFRIKEGDVFTWEGEEIYNIGNLVGWKGQVGEVVRFEYVHK